MKMTANEMLELVTHTLDMNKAQDIVVIPLEGKASYADYMVIASGTSGRHASSLARITEDELRKKDYKESIISGRASGDWILLDSGDIIIHIFRQEVREFYDLEKLWLDPEDLAKRAERDNT